MVVKYIEKDHCLLLQPPKERGKAQFSKNAGECYQWTTKGQCSWEAKCGFKHNLENWAKGTRASTRSPSPSRAPRRNSSGKGTRKGTDTSGKSDQTVCSNTKKGECAKGELWLLACSRLHLKQQKVSASIAVKIDQDSGELAHDTSATGGSSLCGSSCIRVKPILKGVEKKLKKNEFSNHLKNKSKMRRHSVAWSPSIKEKEWQKSTCTFVRPAGNCLRMNWAASWRDALLGMDIAKLRERLASFVKHSSDLPT